MRGQFIAPGARQVVHQWLVAEMISAAPVDAVCLERIAAIRAKQEDASAGLPRLWVGTSEHAHHFAHGQAVVPDVFDHLVAEDQAEGPGGERQGLACRIDDARRAGGGLRSPLKIVFDPDHLAAERRKMLDVHPDAAAILQDAPLDACARGADDQLEPPLLASPPNIRRFAAQGGLFQIPDCHAGNYILQLFATCAKIVPARKVDIEGIEKWATPTFLLV